MLHVTYISSDRSMKPFSGTLVMYSIESYIYTNT